MKKQLEAFEKSVGVKDLKGKALDQITTLLDELKGIAPKKAKKGADEGSD